MNWKGIHNVFRKLEFPVVGFESFIEEICENFFFRIHYGCMTGTHIYSTNRLIIYSIRNQCSNKMFYLNFTDHLVKSYFGAERSLNCGLHWNIKVYGEKQINETEIFFKNFKKLPLRGIILSPEILLAAAASYFTVYGFGLHRFIAQNVYVTNRFA